jgi:hypothetical protein
VAFGIVPTLDGDLAQRVEHVWRQLETAAQETSRQ